MVQSSIHDWREERMKISELLESATAGATSVGSISGGSVGHQLQRRAFNKSYTGSMTKGSGTKSPKQPAPKKQKPGTNALDGGSLVV